MTQDPNTPYELSGASPDRRDSGERERLLDLLLAHYSDVYLSLDENGRLVEARGRFQELFRRAPETGRGQVFWDLFPELSGGELHQVVQRAAQTGAPARISGQLLPWAGWIEVLINPLEAGMELYVRDIASYQQQRPGWAGAEKSQVLFDALLENIPEGILIADAVDGNVLILSQYGQASLAVPREDILHRPFRELIERVTFLHGDGLTPYAYEDHPLIRALTNGDTATDEDMMLRNARGDLVPISSKYGPVYNELGEIIAGIFSWMEISERKEGERILAETARRLESSNQALEAFAYSASHDLQEPLRKIIGFSNLLERSYASELSEQGRDLIERMRNASQRMEKMIDNLLEFSRISARPPSLERVALDNVLENVLLDLEIRIQHTGGQIEVDRLPAVQADPALMEHLFQNLIANALKFHRPDEPPRVRVYPVDSGSAGNGLVRIAVEDNGIGIDPEHRERIFMPFQRLHGRSAYEGNGLGLAIVKKIVDQHGGKIHVQSQPGQGSTFLVDLPAVGGV